MKVSLPSISRVTTLCEDVDYTAYQASFNLDSIIEIGSRIFIRENFRRSFLLPFRSTGKSPPRSALVFAMLKDADLARFIMQISTDALNFNVVHRALLSFRMSVFWT